MGDGLAEAAADAQAAGDDLGDAVCSPVHVWSGHPQTMHKERLVVGATRWVGVPQEVVVVDRHVVTLLDRARWARNRHSSSLFDEHGIFLGARWFTGGLGQAVRSSASISVPTTRSISPVVKLVKNGRRIIRLLTESVTGQSKRLVVQA